MSVTKPPLLTESGLTGAVYIVTNYSIDAGTGMVVARKKWDVTQQFERLAALRAARGGVSPSGKERP